MEEPEYLDPLQDAVRGLAGQPTFSGEREMGKGPAGARFLHRCLVIGFLGSLLPLGIAVKDTVHGLSAGSGLDRPWLKIGTALFALAAGGLAARTRPRGPRGGPTARSDLRA